MPDVLVNNVPDAVYARLQRSAAADRRSLSDTIIAYLQRVFREEGEPVQAVEIAPPLPDPPFLTEEIPAPFDIPWPKGETVKAIDCGPRMAEPHDLPED